MKIEGNPQNVSVEAAGTKKTDGTKSSSNTPASESLPGGTDTLELSAEAQLASRVRQDVASSPAIREDLVEQAKEKLAAGEVGNDPMALADRLIDQMLDE